MNELPPEDQPDVLWIGSVGPIPIIDEDDPRFAEERAKWSRARAKAQSLHSAEELLAGVRDVDWRVRHESVPRLLARWHDDDRTLLTILELAEHDPVWQVRSAAIMKLLSFDSDSVPVAARRALDDASEEVRWSANYVLFQLGHSDSLQPPWRD